MEEAIAFIDESLRDTSLRSLFSQDEVQNMLLDLRWIINPTPEVESVRDEAPEA